MACGIDEYVARDAQRHAHRAGIDHSDWVDAEHLADVLPVAPAMRTRVMHGAAYLLGMLNVGTITRPTGAGSRIAASSESVTLDVEMTSSLNQL